MELSLQTMKTACASFVFESSLFSVNDRIEIVQLVIVSDNRRVTLQRSHAEVALLNGMGSK